MKLMTSSRGIHAVAWVLVFVTAAPSTLLAQTGSGSPIPYGVLPGSAGSMFPGQPIVTNPDALKPIIPHQAPCPIQGSGVGATASAVTHETPGNSERSAAIGMTPSATTSQLQGRSGSMNPGSGSQAQAAIPAPSQTGTGFGAPSGGGLTPASSSAAFSSGAVGLPTHSGLFSSLIQGQQDTHGMSSGLPGQFQVDPGAPLSIEEAFSRFFLLQGMTSQLKQFGYNFFDQSFSGFPLVMDMPVGPDYVLGPEDTLTIHIWNSPESSFNRSYISTVERDGTIFIPQIGSIPVAGSTFAQVNQILQARLSGLLKRFDLHTSIGRLRTIKVFVVGEAVRPGAYELSSLATTSHALYAACGPAKSGSLRHIQVIRANKVVADLDLYEFFLRGDSSHDVRLHTGDTVVITPIGPVVAISGPVRRPAIYELKDRTTLPEFIELAGGMAPSADRRRAQIFRIEAGQKRVIVDVNFDANLNGSAKVPSPAGVPSVIDGDYVRIASVSTQIENAVTLTGAVRAPGPYEFRPGMRLMDLLTPEQLLVDSYVDRAELVRTDPLTYETTVQTINPRALFQGKEDNVELRRLDKVVVATQVRTPRAVTVTGEITRPGTYTVEAGERLSSVLKRAGGLHGRAFLQGLVFMRESVRRQQQVEIERFVAFQKQRLVIEAASYSAGAVPTAGQANQQQGNEATTLQLQMQALDQLVSYVHLGRVVVKAESLDQLEQDKDNDLILEEGDQIAVPQRPQTVSIIGAVRNPANVLHRDGLDAEDYVRQAGGFIPDANEKEMYIVRANGTAEGGYARVRTVAVGDTIVVPERIEAKTRTLPLWQSIASIIGSVALTVAAIAVVGAL
jgi:polysaccharide biosynthesis/export protein